MAQISLKAQRRNEVGKQAAKRLRKAGRLPAVFYGPGEAPSPIAVDAHEVEGILHTAGRNAVISLTLDGEEIGDRITVMKEIQHHPLNDRVLHVDFQHVALTQKIMRQVPVVGVGTPVGVRSEGGVLQHALHGVEVECLPAEIPDQIEVDVSALSINGSIHVQDLLKIDDRIVTDPDRLVFLVVPPTVTKEAVPGEEVEVPEEAKEPELSVERGKKEEEEQEEK